ncbi:MAG: hypothetical protein GY810_07225 [Aureispira sp.]|nr:hypothetical protein [Aureispira sp.]
MQLLDDHQLEPLAKDIMNARTVFLIRTVFYTSFSLLTLAGFITLYFAWDLHWLMIILFFVFILLAKDALAVFLDLINNQTKYEDQKITQRQKTDQGKVLFVLDTKTSQHIKLEVIDELYEVADVNCYVRTLKGKYSGAEVGKMIMPPQISKL